MNDFGMYPSNTDSARHWEAARDGLVFRNGPRGPMSFESTELAAMRPEDLRDVEALKLREEFAGRFVKHNELEKAA